MDEENLVIPGNADQALSVPFPAEVRASAAAQTVSVEAGADVALDAGDGDGVRVPGALADYQVSTAGNSLVLERGDGTTVTIRLNGDVDIGFDGGTATARPAVENGQFSIELGGAAAEGGVDPQNVELTDASVGESAGQTAENANNQVILNGQDQTVEVPFDATVTGTAAAETVRVGTGADVDFTGDSNDRVAFDGKLSDFQIQQSGNQITLQRGGNTIDIALNGDVEMAFANGSASANIDTSGEQPQVTLGGVGVGEGFDPSRVGLDPEGAADFGDDSGDSGNGSGQGLPATPAAGGPAPVDAGTAASENINGNQSGTVSGAGGEDRFIFDTGSSADLTIDDFESGDQLFFQGVDTIGDIGVANTGFADGALTLTAGQVSATVTNLASDVDSQIFNATTFQSALGADALAFA